MHDVIIVGAGAAGMTAAIYSCRRKLSTLIISADVGGQTNLTSNIDNYPGIYDLSGPALMKKFETHMKKYNPDFVYGKVRTLVKNDESFTLTLANDEVYESKAVILAYGKIPRTLGIEGEERFFGRGVSTCTICDAPLFEDKTVAVVGGGNSALEAALALADIAKKVYLIHRRKEFRGDEITQEKVMHSKKIELVLEHVPKAIKGDKFVSSFVVESLEGKSRELKVDGIFLEIGYMIKAEFIEGLVKTNEKGEIITSKNAETSCKGIFAAGDSTDVAFKQTVISAGEGATAALSAYGYIKGTSRPTLDWH